MFFLKQTGFQTLVVGGVRFLDDFSDVAIALRATGANILIEGTNLEICYFCVNEIQIKGHVERISFEKKSGFLKRGPNGKET